MQSASCRPTAEVQAAAIDLATLQELPMEVQQEVARAMVQERKFPTTRPGFEPMQKDNQIEGGGSRPEEETLPEAVWEVWPRIAAALEQAEELLQAETGMPCL